MQKRSVEKEMTMIFPGSDDRTESTEEKSEARSRKLLSGREKCSKNEAKAKSIRNAEESRYPESGSQTWTVST